MERVCGRGGLGKNHRDAKGVDSKKLWKSVEKSTAVSFRRAREDVGGTHDHKGFIVFPVKYLASSLNSN
jgi:hypothetical protein